MALVVIAMVLVIALLIVALILFSRRKRAQQADKQASASDSGAKSG